MAKGSPFATFLIIGSTCFFLGLLFASFPYDYYVLWATPTASSSTSGLVDSAADVLAARTPYMAQLETHLRILHASPPLINRILHIVIGTGIIGLLMKLYKPTEANMLFDGASLVLYMCGITVYVANIVKGLRVVTEGSYGLNAEGKPIETAEVMDSGSTMVMGRDDSLRVLAASNTILAVILMGILILQAGQWYANKKELAEIDEMDRIEGEKKAAKAVGGHAGEKKSPADKKKQ